MRLAALVLAVGLALLNGGAVPAALAAEWGGLAPGVSTMDGVRERYGAPSRSAAQKVQGYDTTQWVYEEPRAPAGMRRMVVDFGLLQPAGYRRELVRTVRLEPKPGVFQRSTVVAGWGVPTGTREEAGAPVFFYREGLLVYFDKDGWEAQALILTIPQPLAPAPAVPAR